MADISINSYKLAHSFARAEPFIYQIGDRCYCLGASICREASKTEKEQYYAILEIYHQQLEKKDFRAIKKPLLDAYRVLLENMGYHFDGEKYKSTYDDIGKLFIQFEDEAKIFDSLVEQRKAFIEIISIIKKTELYELVEEKA